MDIYGIYNSKFQAVVDRFEHNFTEHGEVGASFSATVEGDYVCDIFAGHRDAAKSRRWEANTIVNVYSTTKTMSFLCILLLADREQLRVTDKVCQY